jgi:polyisoprenoid-binding protein YceI
MNTRISFMLRACSIAVWALPLTMGLAQAQQKLDPAKSEIAFTSKQMGVPVQGKFQRFDAQLSFDAQHPEAAKASITIELGSATMGAPESDAELPKAPWFNTAKFPQARFVSSTVKSLGEGRYQANGRLTIKGSAQDVVVPFTLKQSGASSEASGSFVIKRLDFKIGEGEWADTSMVANEVQVRFKFTLVR